MSKRTLFASLRESRTARIICAFLALNLVVEIVSPTMAMALTSGPASPEFSSFEPVATTDMVNDFTGDFTYNIPVLNIPGPDGGGYSMSLAYHSGVSSEEEASWVGFGWTLNPGAINRNKRGFPDDYNGVNVINYNKARPSWNQSAKFDLCIEYNSSDDSASSQMGPAKFLFKIKDKLGLAGPPIPPDKGGGTADPADLSLSISHSIRYSNYTGFSIANSFSGGFMGCANLSMNRSGGQNTFGFSVNPKLILGTVLRKWKASNKVFGDKTLGETTVGKKARSLKVKLRNNFLGSHYPVPSFNAPAIQYSVAKSAGAAWNFSGSVRIDAVGVPIGGQLGIAGGMNISATEGEQTQAAYGYLYSAVSNSNTLDNQLYDYQLEKETTFDKHDKNMGVPFNNADIFTATGNGVIGGFRLHHQSIGSFYPNFFTSEVKCRQLGVEIGVLEPIAIGLDVGVGKQTTKVQGKWPKNLNPFTGKEFSDASSAFMQFTNDMGGEMDYNSGTNYDDIVNATITSNKELDLDGDFDLTLLNTKKNTSSYIEYSKTGDLITGVKITNKDGGLSEYLQPVYTRNEDELTVGLSANQDGSYLVTNTLNVSNPMANPTVIGRKSAQQYASSYLLTSNKTYNYIDADGDGTASAGDFGGWTKFDYRQAWGGGSWYRYRAPYAGLKYNAGRLLDITDQTGSMSSGEKEVYYLKCIETKSHIAFFVTNKTSAATFTTNFPAATYPFLYSGGQPVSTVTDNISGSGATRLDGFDAAAITASLDPAANSLSAKGSHDIEMLEKIVLFSKTDLTTPLTTTFFEYDNSLCPGIPNSGSTANSPSKDRGKLTLKRLWTESNGVNKSKISPYQFFYEYFNAYPSQITSKYSWASDFNLKPSNDWRQNPQYKPEQLDAWGNYQENGDQRFRNLQPWLSQRPASADFDAAAWQLKRIKLPSGGEIHVHYEQKDYSSVQDHVPMAMVSLKSDSNQDDYKSDASVFCINLDDLNIPTDGSVSSYTATLYNYFITQRNKLYFKVLYAYTGDDTPQLNTQNKRYEYVTGYTTVHDVTTSSGKIFLYLGDTRNNLLADVGLEGKKDKTLPRYVCYQELLTNGGHNLGMNAASYKDENFDGQAYSTDPVDEDVLKSEARTRVVKNTVNMFGDWVGGLVKNVKKADACKEINFGLSYFKLPMPSFKAKKGGGIRVARLLTYDPGIETGDAMVFGTEYIYKNTDGTSSGAATNEPPEMREENALVDYMERKKQKWIEKISNGRDTKQFEGPMGENVMPAAEVGHGRVVIKNIHSGKSSTGYVVNEYHTCREKPFFADWSDISKKKDVGTYKKFHLNLPLGIFNMDINKAWVTQGYIFKSNDWHGKLSRKSSYAGNYDPNNFMENAYTSRTTNNYSDPGASIATLVYDRSTGEFKQSQMSPGIEEDYTIFTSNVYERSNDFSIELDVNIEIPVAFTLGFGASYSFSENQLCQHVTSKVVNQVSYLLSTTNVTDGVKQTTENLAFDKYTGDPVLTRTYDGYRSEQEAIYTENDGSAKHAGYYYSLNIPASWMYADMAAKSQSVTNTNQLSAMAGNVVTYGSNRMFDSLMSNYSNGVWSPTLSPLTNIVNATATTFTNNWFDVSMASDYPALATTTVLNAANKFYYPLRSFSYREDVVNANASGKRIYEGGITNSDFKFFDWVAYQTNTVVPSQWYSDSKITRYSPYGYPIEEEDVLAIKSSARFGYNNMLPVMVAQNSAFAESKFIDFEYGLQSGQSFTSTAHTGLACFHLSDSASHPFVSAYPISSDIVNTKGLSIRLWLKSTLSTDITNINYGLKNPDPRLKAMIGTQLYSFKPVAQTGEWTLYSAEIRNFNGLNPGTYNIYLSYNYLAGEHVYVDDFRIQPLNASLNCSVYNSNNKLSAQFDDQHFATLYEYNNKGQLVRKSIETERGRKTLQEQQYNTPMINK